MANQRINIRNGIELRIIFTVIAVVFAAFLLVPMLMIGKESLATGTGTSMDFYAQVFAKDNFAAALGNSLLVSALAGILTTVLAFILAYAVNYTNIHPKIKKLIEGLALMPMLLPTITYGFAIIYSFGKQGLITMLCGKQLFEIYGYNGLLIGYVVYTLPVCFLLINNTMGYVDKKFMIVSRAMGDSKVRCFMTTVITPLLGTFAASFIQSFTLSFTDYGIPTSVGGNTELIANMLYNEMLGSLPNFNTGSAVAVIMLLPSIVSITLLTFLERYNIRYNKISTVELPKNKARDWSIGIFSMIFLSLVVMLFAVIFLVPFAESWPYRPTFTFDNVRKVLGDFVLVGIYRNSLLTAILTAVFGTLTVYGAALITARSKFGKSLGKILDSTALVTNAIPGMVLGVALLLTFKGTPVQNTFVIIIVCNIIHFFSSPYLMMKNCLEKLNSSWENTARLMGDSWFKTVVRIVTPNAFATLLEVFNYYFVNAMVTVSAVIFIAGARTMVITAKIKELQHFANFNQIFVLSILILLTNVAAKCLFKLIVNIKAKKNHQNTKGNKIMLKGKFSRKMKSVVALGAALAMTFCLFTSCGSKADEQVVIYSNADDEAVQAMTDTLNNNGYEGKYIFQTFGTSELGGKLLAEGKDIEADVVTMSTYYIDSAQQQSQMFKDLDFDVNTMKESPKYYAPMLANQGAIIVNTEVMKENKLPMPKSVKDLAKPVYKGQISVVDIEGSSTAWLMIQSLVHEYGEAEAQKILTGIYENAGAHLEQSGSGPIKKVRAGEVAIGFGLRHQAIADKKEGLPIDFVDPAEGNYTLTEGLAVVDKGDNTNPLAMEIVKCIVENGRTELMKSYPVPLYNGEKADANALSKNSREFPEPLSVDLLKKHVKISQDAKAAMSTTK